MTATITSTIVQPTKDPQDGTLVCPIVSSMRSPCYRLTKELPQILSPLSQIHCQEHKRAFVKNLQETQTTFHNHMVNLMWRTYTLQCLLMRPLWVKQVSEQERNLPVTCPWLGEWASQHQLASWSSLLNFLWSSYFQMRCQALSDLWLSEWDVDSLQETLRGREGNRCRCSWGTWFQGRMPSLCLAVHGRLTRLCSAWSPHAHCMYISIDSLR